MDEQNNADSKDVVVVNHKPGGGFAKGNKLGNRITSAQVPEMTRMRMEKARRTAVLAMEDAADELEINIRDDVSEYGWYAVLNHIAKLILTSKDPKGLAELIKILGQASGNLGQVQREQSSGDTVITSDVRQFIGNLADIVRAKEK